MPVSLKSIISNTATVIMHVGDDTLTVEYYPALITEKTIADLQKFGTVTGGEDVLTGFETVNHLLSTLILSWDLYQDEEQTIPYPLNIEALGELPMLFRVQVLQEIMQDLRPERAAS